jgi:hypothetical protein
MAERMLVICPTSQAKVAAADWHDGQITRHSASGYPESICQDDEQLLLHPPSLRGAKATKQSRIVPSRHPLDCFAGARNDGGGSGRRTGKSTDFPPPCTSTPVKTGVSRQKSQKTPRKAV